MNALRAGVAIGLAISMAWFAGAWYGATHLAPKPEIYRIVLDDTTYKPLPGMSLQECHRTCYASCKSAAVKPRKEM